MKGSVGNCEAGDNTDLLDVMTDTYRVDDKEMDITTVGMVRRYDLLIRDPIQFDQDYTDILNVSCLSEFQEEVLPYISGKAAQMTFKRILCFECRDPRKKSQCQVSSTSETGAGFLSHLQVL